MKHRQAKNPSGGSPIKPCYDNQSVLRSIEGVLNGSLSVITAFTWSKTPEGHTYWDNYSFGERTEEEMSHAHNRLLEMVEELATPLKPINKEDWL